MVRVEFDRGLYAYAQDFPVEDGDFSTLDIREATANPGYHYFYDASKGRLVTEFVLENGERVATLCHVTLIKKDGRFSPRIKLWKRDKTKTGGKEIAFDELEGDASIVVQVKAIVDTKTCYRNFWKMVNYLQSLPDVELPDNTFRVVESENVDLVKSLQGKDKRLVVDAVREALGGQLTDADIRLLADRKKKLETFELLMSDDEYFERARVQLGKDGSLAKREAVWQAFFEKNQWIFGYGLNIISTQAVDDGKLERITTGANLWGGAGKRIDAVLRSRGFISSLMFCEIKTHTTPLLCSQPYRPPDVYRVSDELSGAVSQLQKSVDKALRDIGTVSHRMQKPDGTPTRVEVSAIRPKQVLVIGRLQEFEVEGGVNFERSTSFELYRRGIMDIEIITFDELHERVRFIAEDLISPAIAESD